MKPKHVDGFYTPSEVLPMLMICSNSEKCGEPCHAKPHEKRLGCIVECSNGGRFPGMTCVPCKPEITEVNGNIIRQIAALKDISLAILAWCADCELAADCLAPDGKECKLKPALDAVVELNNKKRANP